MILASKLMYPETVMLSIREIPVCGGGGYENDHTINKKGNAGKSDRKFIICSFQSSDTSTVSVRHHHLSGNSNNEEPSLIGMFLCFLAVSPSLAQHSLMQRKRNSNCIAIYNNTILCLGARKCYMI